MNFTNNPLKDKRDWIGSSDEPLVGFSWKAGSSRHTSGVIVWSDVFLYDTKNEKIAIVLMDTQGLFDTLTTSADNSRIFALGTLLSSTQIFNLNGVVQEDQLAYLEAATSFAKFTLEEFVVDTEAYTKPFQNLVFLMRDWEYKESFEYGEAAGARYINNVLDIKSDQSPALRTVRNYIRKSFDKINCFLMPHPGYNIVSNKHYNGSWADLDVSFKDNLEDFIDSLLKPKSLNKKRIMGKEVTGKTFAEYAKIYLKTFQAPSKIDPVLIYAVTLEKQLEGITDQSLDFYRTVAKNFEDLSQPKELIEKALKQAKLSSVLMYKSFRKMGSTVYDLMYEKELDREIDQHYNLTMEILLDTQEKMKEAEKVGTGTEDQVKMLTNFFVQSLKIVEIVVQNEREKQLVLLRQETEVTRKAANDAEEKLENDSIL